ncbi:hypothetical protein DFS34DRAFT_650764 [Phlyctochytrium arcticum]|nr:hypothetical protein DFS34DRAFT_650764 [Phlyctochytrium arcticum]
MNWTTGERTRLKARADWDGRIRHRDSKQPNPNPAPVVERHTVDEIHDLPTAFGAPPKDDDAESSTAPSHYGGTNNGHTSDDDDIPELNLVPKGDKWPYGISLDLWNLGVVDMRILTGRGKQPDDSNENQTILKRKASFDHARQMRTPSQAPRQDSFTRSRRQEYSDNPNRMSSSVPDSGGDFTGPESVIMSASASAYAPSETARGSVVLRRAGYTASSQADSDRESENEDAMEVDHTNQSREHTPLADQDEQPHSEQRSEPALATPRPQTPSLHHDIEVDHTSPEPPSAAAKSPSPIPAFTLLPSETDAASHMGDGPVDPLVDPKIWKRLFDL